MAGLLRGAGAVRVFVFGSLARGEAMVDSDLDLVAIVDTDLPYHERGVPLLQGAEPTVPVDLLVLTPQEFDANPNARLLQVLREEGVEL